MRKFMSLFIPLILVVALVGCLESDEDAYDRDGFKVVKDYIETIIPAVDETVEDAEEWLQNRSEENLEKATIAANEVKEVNDDLFKFGDREQYGEQEIKKWTIDLSLEEGEWVIEGDELAEALFNVKADSNRFAEKVLELEQQEDSKEQLNELIEHTKESTNVVREMFRR